MARLALVVPVALLITLALLFNAFRGLGLALLTLANVPFALVGGVAGLAFFGMPVSVAAAVGFIALIGQASLNGVLVLSAVEDLRRGGASRREAIVRGCLARLRPVLMTAALAALGLVPAALSRAMGAETQRPIAVVIVGGTLSAALLTLVVLPVMYDLVGPRTAGKKGGAHGRDPGGPPGAATKNSFWGKNKPPFPRGEKTGGGGGVAGKCFFAGWFFEKHSNNAAARQEELKKKPGFLRRQTLLTALRGRFDGADALQVRAHRQVSSLVMLFPFLANARRLVACSSSFGEVSPVVRRTVSASFRRDSHA